MTMNPVNDDRPARAVLSISDHDLSDYVADRLSPGRRADVEGYLACNPDIAARVMTQLHLRDRATAAPSRRRATWGVATVAMTVACVVSAAGGWRVAQGSEAEGWRAIGGKAAPAYVEDAVESQAAAVVRAAMVSQTDTPTLDAAEIHRSLKLRAPTLPAGWRVIDAQVYPSDDGPALNVVVEATGGRRLNLFAVRADTAATAKPMLARKGGQTVAYWEEGDSAFVLIGDSAGEELLREAEALARAT